MCPQNTGDGPPMRGGGGGGGGGGNRGCYNCGEEGHRSAECPNCTVRFAFMSFSPREPTLLHTGAHTHTHTLSLSLSGICASTFTYMQNCGQPGHGAHECPHPEMPKCARCVVLAWWRVESRLLNLELCLGRLFLYKCACCCSTYLQIGVEAVIIMSVTVRNQIGAFFACFAFSYA